ncbi:hypothetical protein DFH08DRAFT_970337 [Mycena albidolilacea]|uniref:DUF6532 domain-containing protein n=1 Tax=Mycena albidolilacea TaxID=1033008 RepID=A0AAD6ZG08_9AGAR|nr:hypothetical protein DFH08DRAFT_970337 [Mycena albidolilacea]
MQLCATSLFLADSKGIAEDSEEEPPVKSKSKSSARKPAAPTIDPNTDGEEEDVVTNKKPARHDFSKIPAASEGSGATSRGQDKSDVLKAVKLTAAKHGRIVAESASEAKSESTSSDSCSISDEESDYDLADTIDFDTEVAQIISKTTKPAADPSHKHLAAHSKANSKAPKKTMNKDKSLSSEDSSSREIDDVAPRPPKAPKKTTVEKSSAEALFSSDSRRPWSLSKKNKSNDWAARKAYSDSEDSMPDAPARRVINSDIEMQDDSFAAQAGEGIAATLGAIAECSAGVTPADPPWRSPLGPLRGAIRSPRRPTAWGFGLFLAVPASEIESEGASDSALEAEVLQPKKKKKSKKVSAARQKQADSEEPEIKTAVPPPQGKSKAKAVPAAPVATIDRPESSWDVSARGVLRDTMVLIKIHMLFVDAYPVMVSRPGFGRPYMIKAARARPGAIYILERLSSDPTFGAILAPIPIDRMNILRGNIKRCDVNCVAAFYGLADLEPDQVKGKLQLDRPFCHGSMSFVLKEELFTNPAFVTQNIERFVSKHDKKPNEPELPDPIVAVVATAQYAALCEYRLTGKRQNIPFTENTYEDIYRNHMATLQLTRENAPKSMHDILHSLQAGHGG